MPNRGPRVNPALVGIICAAVMFGLLFFAFTNVTLFQSTLRMKAQVASGDTLAPGGDVEVAGVKVGTVKAIEQGNGGGALVLMSVDTKKVTMYKDASLEIRPHGVFGPKFVEVNPGTQQAGQFEDGSTIDQKNTSVSVDFEQVLNSLNADTRMSLQTFFYEFGTGSENRGQDIGEFIDSFQTVSRELTPVLQVVANRRTETGRLFENNAVVTETYAASPIDKIIASNADILAHLDAHRADIQGVVVHGNNVFNDLDIITANSNEVQLRTTIQKLPVLLDYLQAFNNDLGQGVYALTPVLLPQHGQSMGDIEVAIRRTQDAFGQCDMVDTSDPANQPNNDTVHANNVVIVPCYGADGKPYVDPATGKVAHHHVNVLLGLHLSPPICPAGTPAPVCAAFSQLTANTLEEEGTTLCGPDSSNTDRGGANAAFGCKYDAIQSAPIPPAGGPPPALFSPVSNSSLSSFGPAVSSQSRPVTFSDLLLGR
ncbi:MAG: phospholipid/cholesterol/gamma-HCH transport system substrate-binding protein [Chloroflexota bacterium]|jgi:virulence factor Mce-like protein|nr:phospholipid/cholesterol/gamma-HCH transport system substrate-binding protein [Chloroflexota bacterium]